MSRRRFPDDFEQEPTGGLWRPRDSTALTDYSDGDGVEESLAATVAEADDLSSGSIELAGAIRDWPTRYYLSAERSAALEMLELPPTARVLELGAGCGAITRYLGERVSEVTAIEGSARRAAIAASRCRDLDNVRVACGRFDDLAFAGSYDIVLMIGVLEYAALYADSVEPFLESLHNAARALDEDGVLVLAIENQLGLKYFAGCAEDHGAPRHAGIEGYVDGEGARTFSRTALGRLLEGAGLAHQEWLLPFPDYKLPSVLLRAADADADRVDRLNLIDWCRQPFEQYDGQREHLFCDHLALGELALDGRLTEVSNSFLVLASGRPLGARSGLKPPDWIARKLNPLRAPQYRTTVTLREQTIERTVERPAETTVGPLSHRVEPSEPVHEHCRSLSWRMLQSIRRREQAETAFELCWRAWAEFLEQSGARVDDEHVDGALLDATPGNLLVGEDGSVRLIDQEWRWHEPVPIDWLLLRSTRSLWHAHGIWIERRLGCKDAQALFRWCARKLGIATSRQRLHALEAMEARLQALVAGREDPGSTVESAVAPPGVDHAPVAEALHASLGVRQASIADPELAAAAAERGIEVCESGAELAWLGRGPSSGDVLKACRDARLIAIEDDDGRHAELLRTSGFETIDDPVEGRLGRAVACWRRIGKRCISIVSPTSDLHGGTIVIFEHARRLAERGHRVFIASLDPKRPDWCELPPGVTFMPIASLDELAGALPDGDAVIATLWTTAEKVARLPARCGRGFYLVQAYESAWAGEPDDIDATYRLPLERLCVSSWLVEQLEQRLGVASTPVINGCDLAGTVDELPARRSAGPVRVGMLYHEAPVKGFADGLAAYERVRREHGDGVQLVLYGTSEPSGLQLPHELHLRPSRAELARLLDGIDIFVFPSRLEGFGLPPLEAMCRGVAVAMTDCGGCSDYARDGAVLLSPPGDVDALAAHLGRLVQDASLRERVAARGLEISRSFGWARASDALVEAIAPTGADDPSLKVLYVEAGPVWFDTFLDPWMQRAFRSLGHELSLFTPRPPDDRYTDRFVKPKFLDRERRRAFLRGEGQLPDELPAVIRRERPDLVFFNHGLLFPPEVLERVRDTGVPTIGWMIDEPQEVDYSANRGRLFDHVLLQDRGSLMRHRMQGNPSTHYLPHGADPDDHRPWWESPVDASYRSDVLMIGTGFPARRELIESIASLDCHVRVIGRLWEGLDAPNVEVLNRPVPPDEAARFYRGARMTLNLHRGRTDMTSSRDVPHPADPNGSFFHIAACGSLQALNSDYPGAPEFLTPGAHYLAFEDAADLRSKVEGVLEDEPRRERAVRAASRQVLRHHTYARQLRRALRDLAPIEPTRRLFALSASARADSDPFDTRAAVPATSVILAAAPPVETLQHSLLGIATGQPETNHVTVVHGGDAALADWLARRGIAQVTAEKADDPAAAFNAAWRRVDGRYIAFAGVGVLLTARLLRRLREALDDDPRRGLVAPALHPAGGEQQAGIAYRSLAELGAVSRRLYLERRGHFESLDSVDPLCWMVRREAIEAVGRLDERFPARTLELADLCARLEAAGWSCGWTASTLAHRLAPPEEPSAADRERARELFDGKRAVGRPTARR